MASDHRIMAQTEALLEGGDLKAALKFLRAARRRALSREDAAVLELTNASKLAKARSRRHCLPTR